MASKLTVQDAMEQLQRSDFDLQTPVGKLMEQAGERSLTLRNEASADDAGWLIVSPSWVVVVGDAVDEEVEKGLTRLSREMGVIDRDMPVGRLLEHASSLEQRFERTAATNEDAGWLVVSPSWVLLVGAVDPHEIIH